MFGWCHDLLRVRIVAPTVSGVSRYPVSMFRICETYMVGSSDPMVTTRIKSISLITSQDAPRDGRLLTSHQEIELCRNVKPFGAWIPTVASGILALGEAQIARWIYNAAFDRIRPSVDGIQVQIEAVRVHLEGGSWIEYIQG